MAKKYNKKCKIRMVTCTYCKRDFASNKLFPQCGMCGKRVEIK